MQPIQQSKIPTILPIFKMFTPDKGVKILCTVPSNASSLSIVLYCGTDIVNQGDIALRLVFDLTSNIISLNSQRKGIWDKEQTILGFQFKYGERIEIVLGCNSFNYKVFINGQHYSDFNQNISYERVTFLAVNGDVVIEQLSCGVEVPTQTSFGFKQSDFPLQHQGLLSTVAITSDSQEPRPKRKIYITYGVITATILIITLCAVFITTKRKDEYDFD